MQVLIHVMMKVTMTMMMIEKKRKTVTMMMMWTIVMIVMKMMTAVMRMMTLTHQMECVDYDSIAQKMVVQMRMWTQLLMQTLMLKLIGN